MLSSPNWFDRDKAMGVLYSLTALRDPQTLDELRRNGLPALTEMARWYAPSYAKDAFTLIGRVANLSDAEIENAWARGQNDRERIIRTAAQAHSN